MSSDPACIRERYEIFQASLVNGIAEAVTAFSDLLNLAPITPCFSDYLTDRFSGVYKTFGPNPFTADFLQYVAGVDLDRERYGIFEPEGARDWEYVWYNCFNDNGMKPFKRRPGFMEKWHQEAKEMHRLRLPRPKP